jgi:tRNA (cytidine/uridine-2'-O-)-methyltransferase
MRIVLFQPKIPQNTGNIARTCSVTGTQLLLVKPLGFSLSSKQLKRAGLDYWNELQVDYCEDLGNYLLSLKQPFYFFSSRAKKRYTDIVYTPTAHLIFGSETEGMPLCFWEKWAENFYTIPMKTNQRCLNLSNAVSIVLYEALRQTHFSSL